MKKFISIFKVKREELVASLVALVIMAGLHVLLILKYWDKFSSPNAGHWNVFINNFGMMGFDPLTYSVITHWDPVYNVYRHPLLAFLVYPLSMLNEWLIGMFHVNLVQVLVVPPLLFCAYYSFVFLYRIIREVVGLRRFDATLLSALFFSFSTIMVTAIVPDHFCLSMFGLLLAVYISGDRMKKQRRLKPWQATLYFIITAGLTLSNGIKIFIYALFVNGKRFFRPRFLLFGVLLPSLAVWLFALWEYRTYVQPKEQERHIRKVQKSEQLRKKAFMAFADTTSLQDSFLIKKAFNAEMERRKQARYKADQQQVWNRHKGKALKKQGFMSWTDISTSRWDTAVENLFGETIQFHQRYLMQDVLRSRPIIVRYSWIGNYVAEALLVLLFVAGIWCGRRSRFLWMCLTGFAFDMALHMGLGFGINEVYIMSAHWTFVIPIAMAFLLRAVPSGRCGTALRITVTLLTAFLMVYNLVLLVKYLLM